ncbi:MAG: helix-turn-helix domain-containing protein [Synergistaceae bacterium]|nr:helix-turn-helix domain-containing protein [Synergistaceae bacterium]MBP9626871.1 helix-turn-helix domain-containing protein [Synergistaceae bacterium]
MIGQSVHLELGETQKIPRHMHMGIELFFLLRGEVDLELGGEVYRMRRDDVILCNQREICGAEGVGPNVMFRVLIPGDVLKEEAGITSGHVFACNSVAASEQQGLNYFELKRIIARLMQAHFQPQMGSQLEMKTSLLQLMGLLFLAFQAENGSGVEHEPERVDRIQPVLDYIHGHYTENLSLQQMAEREHLSVHYLSRLFKQRMGTGFLEYLNRIRLRNAVDDLVYTKATVLKIALNNGFSGAAAFNRLFRRVYHGETPARYRAKRNTQACSFEQGQELTSFQGEQGQEEIIKYLRQFDLKYQNGKVGDVECVIPMDAVVQREFCPMGRILRVGRVCELLKAEIRAQLEALCAELVVEYVHFRCLFGDGMYVYSGSMYATYEYDQIFDYLHDLSLVPFIELDVQEVLRSVRLGASIDKFMRTLTEFLARCIKRYGLESMYRWRFEISSFDIVDQEQLFPCYICLREVVHAVLPNAVIGVGYHDSSCRKDVGVFLAFLHQCGLHRHLPDFIGIRVGTAMHPVVIGEEFSSFRHLNAARVRVLRELIASEGLPALPIVLMDWNTLFGFTTMENNAFYRVALFMDELLELSGSAESVAVWVNTYVQEAATGRADFMSLALYFYKGLKRPIYFAMQLLDRLQSQVLYQSDSVLLTRGEDGTRALLVFNPCYFNPQYASDELFVESLVRRLRVTLKNFEGHFLFERYHVDQSSGAIYDRWAKMGFPSLANRDIMEYLEKNVSLEYSLFEDRANGSYEISLELRFNAAVLLLIRPL